MAVWKGRIVGVIVIKLSIFYTILYEIAHKNLNRNANFELSIRNLIFYMQD